jgi:Protein of unknown function (DUF2924)
MQSVNPDNDRGRDRPRPVARPRTITREPGGHAPRCRTAIEESGMRHSHDLKPEIEDLDRLSRAELRALWARELGDEPPASLGRDVLALAIAYTRQERLYGGLTRPVANELDRLLDRALRDGGSKGPQAPTTPLPRTGTILVREWQGTIHHVTIVNDGFVWNGQTHRSLSSIARAITGTKWNGPRFFGMREVNGRMSETRRGR